MFLLKNSASLSALVSSTLKNLNARSGKQKIDRRELEQAISPGLSNGKSHAALVSDLVNAPRTSGGALIKATKDVQEANILSNRMGDIASQIRKFRNYDEDSTYFLSKLKEVIVASGIPNENTDPLIKETYDIFNNLIDSIDSKTVKSVEIDGADIEDIGSEDGYRQFSTEISIVYGKNSLSFYLTWTIEDGTRVDDIDEIMINNLAIDDWVEETYGKFDHVHASQKIIESGLNSICESILFQGIKDISNKNPDISPELMTLLGKELL